MATKRTLSTDKSSFDPLAHARRAPLNGSAIDHWIGVGRVPCAGCNATGTSFFNKCKECEGLGFREYDYASHISTKEIDLIEALEIERQNRSNGPMLQPSYTRAPESIPQPQPDIAPRHARALLLITGLNPAAEGFSFEKAFRRAQEIANVALSTDVTVTARAAVSESPEQVNLMQLHLDALNGIRAAVEKVASCVTESTVKPTLRGGTGEYKH